MNQFNPANNSSHSNPNHLEFHRNPTQPKQPLYRPTALRRNQSYPSVSQASDDDRVVPFLLPSPTLSAWSTMRGALTLRISTTTGTSVRGEALPKDLWKADGEVVICCYTDCSTKFGLIERKHHCRRCGDLFCRNHSSHSIFLWPPAPSPSISNGDDNTPRSYFSLINSSSSASPRRAASPGPGSSAAEAISARVCDECYYSTDTPTSTSNSIATSPAQPFAEPGHFNSSVASSPSSLSSLSNRHQLIRPLTTTRHSSRNSTPASSPNQSPTFDVVKPRRRRASGGSGSTASGSSASTPPTSISGSIEFGMSNLMMSHDKGVSEIEEEEAEDQYDYQTREVRDRMGAEEYARDSDSQNNHHFAGGHSYQQGWATF